MTHEEYRTAALNVVYLAACAVNGKPTVKSPYEEAGGSSEFATSAGVPATTRRPPCDPADTLPPEIYGDNVVVDDPGEDGHIDDPTPAQEPMRTEEGATSGEFFVPVPVPTSVPTSSSSLTKVKDPHVGTEVGKNDDPGPGPDANGSAPEACPTK